jgi:hypothetical protein
VRLLLEKVQRDLKQATSQRLSGKAQEILRESQRYVKQANDALNDGNLVQAYAAADKAAALAAELLPR